MPGQRFSDGKSRVSQAGRQVVVSPAMQLPATPVRLGLPGWPSLGSCYLSSLSSIDFCFRFQNFHRSFPGRARPGLMPCSRPGQGRHQLLPGPVLLSIYNPPSLPPSLHLLSFLPSEHRDLITEIFHKVSFYH